MIYLKGSTNRKSHVYSVAAQFMTSLPNYKVINAHIGQVEPPNFYFYRSPATSAVSQIISCQRIWTANWTLWISMNWRREVSVTAAAFVAPGNKKIHFSRLTCKLGNPSCSCTTGRGKGNRVEAVKCRTVTRPSFRSTPTPFPICWLRNQLNKKKENQNQLEKCQASSTSSVIHRMAQPKSIQLINGVVRRPQKVANVGLIDFRETLSIHILRINDWFWWMEDGMEVLR